MTRLHRFAALVAAHLIAFGLGACGESGSKGGIKGLLSGKGSVFTPQAEVADDLAALLPKDAIALLYVPSIDSTLGKVRALADKFEPGSGDELNVEEMLAGMPGGEHIDLTRPLALAVLMSEEGDPLPVLVAPCKDVAAAKAAFVSQGAPEPTTRGSYLFVPMGPGPVEPGGGSALIAGIPGGDVVLRIELKPLLARFGGQLDRLVAQGKEQLAEFERMGGDEMSDGNPLQGFATAIDDAIGFVKAGERLDVLLGIKDDRLSAVAAFTLQANAGIEISSLGSADLLAHARSLPPTQAIAAAFQMDWAKFYGWYEKFLENMLEPMPAETADAFRRQMVLSKELSLGMGDRHAFSMSIGADGLRFVQVSSGADPAQYLVKFKNWVAQMNDYSAETGMSVTMEAPRQVGGVEVQSMRMHMDMQAMLAAQGHDDDLPPETGEMFDELMTKMFGEDGMRMSIAAVDDRLLVVMGGGDSAVAEQLARMRAPAALPDALAAAGERAGGTPIALVGTDLRRLVGGILEFVRVAMPPDLSTRMPAYSSDGVAAPASLWLARQDRTLVAGVEVDLEGIRQLVDAVRNHRQPR